MWWDEEVGQFNGGRGLPWGQLLSQDEPPGFFGIPIHQLLKQSYSYSTVISLCSSFLSGGLLSYKEPV